MTDGNTMWVYGDIDAPKRPGDSGYDLHAPHRFGVPAHSHATVMTDAYVQLPDGCGALVVGRSGNNARGLHAQVGWIDGGYRGRIGVVLVNVTDARIMVEKGDRIAQLVIFPVVTPTLVYVDDPSDLSSTERGEQGFGSTGQ